jgi:hypothetical protein
MKKTLSIIAITSFIWACNPSTKTTETTDQVVETVPTITKLWSSDTTVLTPESVLFYAQDSVLFVSCIAGVPPSAKDGDGFISKLSPKDGSIIELKWATGLSAPKGMGIYQSKLYVTDIDQIVEIDIASGQITNSYAVEGATFLNDIDVSEEGDIYFTDMGTNTIHLLKGGEISTVLTNAEFNGPNGLSVKGDQLLMSTSGSGNFYQISRADLSYKVVTDSIFGGDGVEQSGDDFIVSSWNGEIYLVKSDGQKLMLLDTKGIANTADIEFDASTNTIFVPTFFGNKVEAYKLTK